MRIYFYHTQDIQKMYAESAAGRFPSHFLYGAVQLEQMGHEIIWHKHHRIDYTGRFTRPKQIFNTTREILSCRKDYDVLYATSWRGLEFIVLLRALHLFRHTVALWHHQPVTRSSNALREALSRFYYRGIDSMFFFSRALLQQSVEAGKCNPSKMSVVHWGADMSFYDRIRQDSVPSACTFISTGKEMRDIETLLEAFRQSGESLQMYLNLAQGDRDYGKITAKYANCGNILIDYPSPLSVGELAVKVAQASCAVICCRKTNYTVGLTTLVEALALGKPIICSRNMSMPVDIEKEGIGIYVDYYDVEGWKKAISFIASHPADAAAMGRRSLDLARNHFNALQCAREVESLLHMRLISPLL